MPPPSKRRKTSAVEEVVFDPSARAEYLTGFHKRKQARIKHAQEIAVKREKEEKRRDREELRRQREENLEKHVQAVNESMRIMNGLENGEEGEEGAEGEVDGEDEWNGLDAQAEVNGKDEEYVDEDAYATVTVEAVDITKDGFVTHGDSDEDEQEETGQAGSKDDEEAAVKKTEKSSGQGKKRAWTKEKPANGERSKRKKKRNFKYESKEERKANRTRTKEKRKAHAIARKGN